MSARRRRKVRIAVQIVGFLVGLALLGWCARMAFSPENTEELKKIVDAGWGEIAEIMALSVASLVLNSLAFWFGLAPVRKLPILNVLSTNAIATFLSYMPFKIGLITRIAIHNRYDRIPLFQIGAWFTTTTLVLFAALIPIMLVSLAFPGAGITWGVTCVAAIGVSAAVLVLLSRVFEGERGLARLRSIADTLRLPVRERIFGFKPLLELHKGFSMASHGKWVGLGVTVRLLDMLMWAMRLKIVAEIAGIEITVAQALVIGVVQFLLGAVSPSGQLGVREIGAAGLAHLLAVTEGSAFSAVALGVTALEAVVNLTGAALGVSWLGFDRLFGFKRRPEDRDPDDTNDDDESA